MDIHPTLPRVFHVLEGQALEVRPGPYGAVGTLFSGEGLEAVWVSKQNEAIDSDWFSQDSVDVLVVLQGQLRIEFANPDFPPCLLQLGAVLSRLSGERRDFGLEQRQIEDFLTQRGFTQVVSVNAEQLQRLYCTGPNQGRTVSENYAIVHAQVGESQE